MTYQTIVAMYERPEDAVAARQGLVGAGIRDTEITMRGPNDVKETRQDKPGFWSWLIGSDHEAIPETHRQTYYDRIQHGNTLLVVRADDTHRDFDRVSQVMESHNPVRLDDGLSDYSHPWAGAAVDSDAGAVSTEEVIPEVKEEVHVGKRQVGSAKAYRIRSVVTETPVEESVRLHDETVTVEKRPPTAGVTADGDPFVEKTVEVRETHEEPVVEKTARVEDEVVVRKQESDRTETVRDTARETHVEVDEDPKKRR